MALLHCGECLVLGLLLCDPLRIVFLGEHMYVTLWCFSLLWGCDAVMIVFAADFGCVIPCTVAVIVVGLLLFDVLMIDVFWYMTH